MNNTISTPVSTEVSTPVVENEPTVHITDGQPEVSAALIGIRDYGDIPVRIFGNPEAPLYVAVDVCRCLDLANPSKAIASLDEDEKATLTNSEGRAGNGAQTFNVITESGLYALIFKSRKAKAKEFRKWVTSVVIPSIRKTGQYSIPEQPPVIEQPAKEPLPNNPFTPMEDLRLRLIMENISESDFIPLLVQYKYLQPGQGLFDLVEPKLEMLLKQWPAAVSAFKSFAAKNKDAGYALVGTANEAEFFILMDRIKASGACSDVSAQVASELLRSRQTNPVGAMVGGKPFPAPTAHTPTIPEIIWDIASRAVAGKTVAEVQRKVQEECGIAKSRFYQIWHKLKADGKIIEVDNGWEVAQ